MNTVTVYDAYSLWNRKLTVKSLLIVLVNQNIQDSV